MSVSTNLSLRECARLLALTGRLHAVARPEQPGLLLQSLRELIPFQLGVCHGLRPDRREMVTCHEPQSAPRPVAEAEFWRLIKSHPLHAALHAAPPRAWKITDVMTREQFQRTELFQALYAPWQVDYEMAALIPETPEGGCFLICLHRRGRDFTEKEREILNLLLPPIMEARRSAPREAVPIKLALRNEDEFHHWVRHQTRWPLSRRECDVLFWLGQGKSNDEVGGILGITGRTAETHALRVYPKIGVENRCSAVALLNQLAIIGKSNPLLNPDAGLLAGSASSLRLPLR